MLSLCLVNNELNVELGIHSFAWSISLIHVSSLAGEVSPQDGVGEEALIYEW
jgi:hypothetical protein